MFSISNLLMKLAAPTFIVPVTIYPNLSSNNEAPKQELRQNAETDRVSATVRSGLEHPSSDVFETAENKNQLFKNYMDRLYKTSYEGQDVCGFESSAAEAASSLHQIDVLGAIDNSDLKSKTYLYRTLDFDIDAYQFGVIQSDLGKLRSYKELFTIQSPKSDLFLNTITGRSDSAASEAIKEVLGGQTLLNSSLELDEIRSLFKELPILQGFFHELPGIADAILGYELDIFTRREFQSQLKANLFHNGPRAGFWKMFAEIFIPGAVRAKGLEDKFIRLLKNTPFEISEDETLAPSYPYSLSFEGVLHQLFDRVSQGSLGGLYKIYHELSASKMSPQNRLLELKTVTIQNTINQIQVVISVLSDLDCCKEKQKEFIRSQAERSILYLKKLNKHFSENVFYYEEINSLIIGDLEFILDGSVEQEKDIGETLKRFLVEYEKEAGDPMHVLVEGV